MRSVVGATVQLTGVRPGKYAGRVVADVWVDGRELSALLIAENLGRPYRRGRRRGWARRHAEMLAAKLRRKPC